MNISNPQLPNQIIEVNGEVMRMKLLNTGTWNMDTTAIKDVTHGLVRENIRAVQVMVRNDTLARLYPFGHNANDLAAADPGGAIEVYQTFIRIIRVTTGFFDHVDFDDAVINRGWVLIWFVA